jgi:hypothetical protein
MLLSAILQENVAGRYSGFELVWMSLPISQFSLASSTSLVSKNFTGSICARHGVIRLAQNQIIIIVKNLFIPGSINK